MSGEFDPLALLHPDGWIRRATVIGEGCPEALRPTAPSAAPADLIILAPGRREGRSDEWLTQAVATATTVLDADGIVYAFGPATVRRKLLRGLTAAGCGSAGTVLHIPGSAGGFTLVLLEPDAVRWTAAQLMPPGRGRQILLKAGPRLCRWLSRFHPSAGLVLHRSGARPLGQWTERGRGRGITAIRVRQNALRSRALVYLLPADDGGTIVKAVLRGPDDVRLEAERLASVAPGGGAAGVAVPAGEILELGPRSVLVQQLLSGMPASWMLARRPESIHRILAALTEWLARWGAATSATRAGEHAWLADLILRPAERMAGHLEGGAAYVRWLTARCEAMDAAPVGRVAVHGDLTMSNVLVREGGGLGVVDWEASDSAGLPLQDLYYAAVDAAAAQHGYRDRKAAWDRCFAHSDALARTVQAAVERLRAELGVAPALATLAFHACWLRHAENEQRKRSPGQARPFLYYLQRAAAQPDLLYR